MAKTSIQTIPLSYVLSLLQELQKMGHSVQDIYAGASVPYAGIDLECSESTLPEVEFIRLYAHALRLLEVETSCCDNRSQTDKNAIEMICYCTLSCATLADAIDRVESYANIQTSNLFALSLRQTQGTASVIMDYPRSQKSNASLMVSMASMSVFYQLFSWLIGLRIHLRSITVQYAAPSIYLPMAEVFATPITYDAPLDTFSFSDHYLDRPVVRSFHELKNFIDFLPFYKWYGSEVTATLSSRIRTILMTSMERGSPFPNFDAIAQLFCMSPATIRRRLRDEGTLYTQIKSDCQRERAEYLLTFTDLNIQEISNQLGFSDDRSFRRVFNKWNECGPREYRTVARHSDELSQN